MSQLLVRELMALAPRRPCLVRAGTPLPEVVALLTGNRASREAYLVDDDGRFRGVITLRRLARRLFPHDVRAPTATTMLDRTSARTAGDLAQAQQACVGLGDTLAQVLDLLFRLDLEAVPIVDEHGIVVGSLDLVDVVGLWQRGRLGGHGRAPE